MNDRASLVRPGAEFLNGGGVTGAFLRAHDWSTSPLGDPATWPQPLRTAASLMLGAAQPVYIAWGAELTSLYNDGYLLIVGTKHPGIGQPFATLWAEIWDEFRPLVEKTLAGEAQHFVDMPIALAGRPGRPVGYFTFSYTALRDADGSVAGFYCAATETTDKVLAQAALRASEARSRGVFTNSPTPLLVLAPDAPRFTITDVNDAYLAATMTTRQGLIGRGLFEAFPDNPHDSGANGVANLRASLLNVLASRAPDAMPLQRYDIARPDGVFQERWWDPINKPLLDAQGRVEAILHHATDMTAKHRADALLRASEARFRGVLDCMAEGFGLMAPDFTLLELNAEAMRLETRPRDAIVGRTHWQAYPGSEDSEVGRLYKRAMAERVPVMLEHRYAWEDGRVAWLDMRAYPAADGGLAIFYRDVTERMLAAERLRASEVRQRFLLALGDEVRALGDPLEVVAATTRALGACLGAARVVYADIDEEHDMASAAGDWTDGTVPHLPAQLRLSTYGSRLLDPLKLGRTLRVDDVREHAATAESLAALRAIGVGALVSVPLLKDGRLVANINVHQGGARAWTDAEVELIEVVAERTWEALERARAAAGLRAMEERLRLAVDNAEVGFWDVDAVHDTLVWPPRTKAMFGIPADAPVSMQDFYDGLHPDDRAATSEAYAAAADPARRALYDVEYRTVGKQDGAVRWVAAKGRGVFDRDGRCLRVAGTVIDITARKAADAALRASEARFEAIANSVDQMVWTTRPDGFHDYYNDRWYEFTGVPHGSTDGEAWAGMFHPDDQDRTWATWRHCLATGEPYHIEYRLRHRSRQYRWVIGRAQCVRDEAGRVMRWFGTCTDIHEIIEAREVLARSRQDLERLIDERTAERDRMWETSPDLMLAIGADGVFRRVNPAWTTILGYTADELVGHHVNEFVLPEDHARTVDAYQQAAEGARPAVENRYQHKDGSTRWIAWTSAPAGDVAYATGRDMTTARERQAELEAAQDALRQSQKMEAVGQLTGGIAHDFNNMLAVVLGSLELLARRIGAADARATRYVDAATNGARRAALLTQRLLAFSRQQPLRPEPVDANKLVSGMSDLLRHSLGGAVQLETVLAGGLWRIHADPNQLENVILNLAVNARDAMPQGGKLTIETQNTHLDSRYVATHPGVTAGQYVLIAVTDTGSGMLKEVLAKAFDPFFTTKEVGKGTGLGLSQVYGFVKQSSGQVKIYSEPDHGTTFKVYLPRHIGAAEEEHDESTLVDLPLGEIHDVVLVVEDEPTVRQFSVDALVELGYRVLEADGAASALRLLDAHPEIALLFTDIVMPTVNGAKLAEEARRRRPDLRVLFTTGYTRNAVVHNGVVDPGVELIGKPFTIDELAAKVRAVLDAPVPGAESPT